MSARSLLRLLLAAAALTPGPALGQGAPDRLTERVRQTAEELRTGPERDGASSAYAALRRYAPRLGLDLPPFRPEEPRPDLEPQIDSLVAAGRPEEAVALADSTDEAGRFGVWAHFALFRVQDRFGTRRALDVAFRHMRRPARVVHSIISRSGDPPRPWDPAILDQIAAAPLDDETRAAALLRAMGAMAEGDPDAGWHAARTTDLGTEAGAELALWILIGLERNDLRRPYADSLASALIDALPRLPPNRRSSYTTSVVDHCTELELAACDRVGLFDTLNPAAFARYGTRCESAEGFWDAVLERDRRLEDAGAPRDRRAAFRAMVLAQGGVTFWGATCDPRMDSVFTAWMPALDALEPSFAAAGGDDLRVHLALAWAARDPERSRGPASRIADAGRRDSTLAEVVGRAWNLAPLAALDVWRDLATGPSALPEDGFTFYRAIGREADADAVLTKLTESARFEARLAWARTLLDARRHDDARLLALEAIDEWTPTGDPPSLSRPYDTLVRLGLLDRLIDRIAAVDDPVARGATLAEVVGERLRRR